MFRFSLRETNTINCTYPESTTWKILSAASLECSVPGLERGQSRVCSGVWNVCTLRFQLLDKPWSHVMLSLLR